MVHVKEYSLMREGDKFYIDCLLRDFHINVKVELEKEKFEQVKNSVKREKQQEVAANVYMFNKIGYISFPTTVAFFPDKNLIYTKLIALTLPRAMREVIS